MERYSILICLITLLITCQRTVHSINNGDIRHGTPEYSPKILNIRFKVGSDIILRCNDRHHQRENITWDFKQCESNHKGIIVDEDDLTNLDESDNEWKKLDFGKGKSRLEMRNSAKDNIGVYRCIDNDSIIKIYIVDLYIPEKSYTGPPPEIISLIPSNTTVLPNSNLVIQCKVKSVILPEIRWLKECDDRSCDIVYNGLCYCPITSSNSLHAIDTTIFLSKLSINNIRVNNSGNYTCLVMSVYGKDFKNISVNVQSTNTNTTSLSSIRKSFSVLFVIPFCFVLIPVIVWLCYYKRKRKNRTILHDQQRQLLANKLAMQLEIVLEEDKIV